MQNSSSVKPYLVVAAVLIPVFVAGYLLSNKPASSSTTPVVEGTGTEQAPAAQTGSLYKNGTYSVMGAYTSPAGPEEFPVTIKLENDVIVSAEMQVVSANPISVKLQTDFQEHFQEFVVGKKITEVELTKVSGSSLTPKGFNDALAKVKAEAAV